MQLTPSRKSVLRSTWMQALRAVDEAVPGDFVETGTHTGNQTLALIAVAQSTCGPGSNMRHVYGFDSFQGLPKPSAKDVAHKSKAHKVAQGRMSVMAHTPYCQGNPRCAMMAVAKRMSSMLHQALGVDAPQVRDRQWSFHQGFFNETLHHCPATKIAVLRLDGDMYSSTMDALVAFYPRVSSGGYVIFDDYGTWPGCRAAARDYLEGTVGLNGIGTMLQPVPGDEERSVYWFRKP